MAKPGRLRGLLRRPGGVDLDDIAMLILALFSIGLLLWAIYFDPDNVYWRWVVVIDTSICAVFAIEFLFRWRATGWRRNFPLRNWYEIIGMIPLAHPALRGFRLLRVVVITVRIIRAADAAFGDRFTFRLVDRLSDPIVRAIKRPITLAMLDEVLPVLESGQYAKNIAQSLRENSDDLRGLVLEKLKDDPGVGRFRHIPFHDRIVSSVIDTSTRVVLEVLSDPKIDEFVAHALAENFDQIRRAVQHGVHYDSGQDGEVTADARAG